MSDRRIRSQHSIGIDSHSCSVELSSRRLAPLRLAQHRPDLPHGLPQAVLVLDERHPQEAFAGGAEAAAGADGDVALFQQLHGEVDG